MLPRPLLLDAFSGAGGCGYGYFLAGFHVIGVDINPQPHYPFEFIQDDAIDFIRKHGNEFDFIHTSPPCQRYSVITAMKYRDSHPDLIPDTRIALLETEKPYIIENVPNARKYLNNYIMLCGSSFGLKVFRHRYFELGGFSVQAIPKCKHDFKPVYLTGSTGTSKSPKGTRKDFGKQAKSDASGIDWMSRAELSQAIPPAYTQYVGAEWLRQNGYRYQYPDVYAPKQLELFA